MSFPKLKLPLMVEILKEKDGERKKMMKLAWRRKRAGGDQFFRKRKGEKRKSK